MKRLEQVKRLPETGASPQGDSEINAVPRSGEWILWAELARVKKLRLTNLKGVFQASLALDKTKALMLLNGGVMKEPGLDDRHRDKDGQIQQKRGDTLNKNLPEGPIPEFSPNARLDTMRKETGKTSITDVRKAAKNRKS